MRTKKQQAADPDKARRTQGRQNTFSGTKLVWLDSLKSEYMIGDEEEHGRFYPRTAKLFIEKFGYDLAIGENPPEGVEMAPKDIKATLPQEERDLEAKRRNKYFDDLQHKLGNWYRHRYKPKNINKSIINKLIDGLVASGACRPPRKKAVRELYYELYWEKKLKGPFDTHWDSIKSLTPESEKLNARNLFVGERWANEAEEVRNEVEGAIDKHYEAEVEVWKKKADLEPTSASYQGAWTLAASVLPGLADALAEWLGSCVMITAVSPVNGKIVMQSAQSNAEKERVGRIMAEYNPSGWSAFQNMVIEYGSAYFSPEECSLRKLREKESGSEPSANNGPTKVDGVKNNGAAEIQQQEPIYSHDPTPAIQQDASHTTNWSGQANQPQSMHSGGLLAELNGPLTFGDEFQNEASSQPRTNWRPAQAQPQFDFNGLSYPSLDLSSYGYPPHTQFPYLPAPEAIASNLGQNTTQPHPLGQLAPEAALDMNGILPNHSSNNLSMTSTIQSHANMFYTPGVSTPYPAGTFMPGGIITSSQANTQVPNTGESTPTPPAVIPQAGGPPQLTTPATTTPPIVTSQAVGPPPSITQATTTNNTATAAHGLSQPLQDHTKAIESVANVPLKRRRKESEKALAGKESRAPKKPRTTKAKTKGQKKGKENNLPEDTEVAA